MIVYIYNYIYINYIYNYIYIDIYNYIDHLPRLSHGSSISLF